MLHDRAEPIVSEEEEGCVCGGEAVACQSASVLPALPLNLITV